MNDFYNLKISINKQLSSQRLDKVLVTSLNSYSRTQIKNLILNGNVLKDNAEIKDPSYITKENENYDISIFFCSKKRS
ncbi:MAG: S4 domain-containing protein [Alphaproteobacteria bacterium]